MIEDMEKRLVKAIRLFVLTDCIDHCLSRSVIRPGSFNNGTLMDENYLHLYNFTSSAFGDLIEEMEREQIKKKS